METPELLKNRAAPEDSFALKSSRTKQTDVLSCLMSAQDKAKQHLCTNIHDDFEKIEVMIDSRTSDAVATVENQSRKQHQVQLTRQQLDSKRRTRDTFESPMITARRLGPKTRCVRDLVKTRYCDASAG